MNEAQFQSLISCLEYILTHEYFSETLVENYLVYNIVCTTAKLYGLKEVRELITVKAKTEDDSYTATVYSEINDILFGDISLVPPLIDKHRTLCSWRLLAQENESREFEDPRPTLLANGTSFSF